MPVGSLGDPLTAEDWMRENIRVKKNESGVDA